MGPFCGSWLASDSGTAPCLALCGDAIASKPALTIGPALHQAPMMPPSSRLMATTEERGLALGWFSGKVDPPFSPGC